jgi:hypothetical protein
VQTQDEIKQKLNAGIATDADMDEYIKNGYDYNALGPKSKAFYDERKKLSATPVTTTTDEAPAQTVSGHVQPSSTPATVKSAQPYKMKSIQQAYYDGDIDKNTRDYLLADTIGKFARNMGKDVGNIAAAYSGGTVNNEREASNWDARNAEMMRQGVSAEAATVENSDKQMERAMQKIQQRAGNLKNEQAGYTLSAARKLEEAYKSAKTQTEKNILAALISDVSDGNISEGALMALTAEGAVKDVTTLWDKFFGKSGPKNLSEAEAREYVILQKGLADQKAKGETPDMNVAARIDELRAKEAGTPVEYGPGGTVNGEFPMW